MPDLNLIDEAGFDESPAPAAPPARKKTQNRSGGGGGGGKAVLIIIIILALAGGAAFYLNKTGKIKLWGKKRPPVAQIQDEPLMQEPSPQDQAAQKPADTAQVALLDNPPAVEEKADVMPEPAARKPKVEPVDESSSSPKLSDMQGLYTVRVVLYRDKSTAMETSERLEFSGYPSFVEPVPMKGGNWYKVCVGRYPTHEEAKKAVKSFASQLQSSYVIEKVHSK